ncbi:hypothetical protein [Duffyella gerundensis]|uniref:hypothetical protein n=1 Tax=Duffyella gerundensis TaxID=1619313 RepID=UPI003FD2DD4F
MGALSKSLFLTDQARFAPGSARLLAASLRLALENAFPSAFVMPLKVNTQVKFKGHFVLPEGSPGRARSKAISYRLKPARAGPAVAPALHPRYPANTIAHFVGALSKSVFLTDPARFAPSSTHLLAASLRLILENAFPLAFVMPLKVKTQVKFKGDFVLPEGSPGRARSKAISYRLKPARAGPAVAPALHPRYPANTTAHCVGALGKSVFLTDPARFAPGSTRLLAASLRLILENAFPSAFLMPLKVKTQVKIEKIKDEILHKT